MRLRASLLCLCLLLGMALLSTGCAEEGDKTVEHTPASQTTDTPEPVSPVDAARGAVRAFYTALDASQFRTAWEFLGPVPRSETDGFTSWRDGYSTTVSSEPRGLTVVSRAADEVVFAGSLDAEDVDACGDRIEQTFVGTWTVSQVSGETWIASDISLEKESGATPVFDGAECGAGPAPPDPEPAGSECDPNYGGACLDPNSPDYDCEGGEGDGPDYTGFVEVVGDDPHDLDRDGNGLGCE